MKTSSLIALVLMVNGAALLPATSYARKGNDDAQEHRCRHCDDSRHHDRKGRSGRDVTDDRSGRNPDTGSSSSSGHKHRGRGRGRGRGGDSED
jgi:hypothetical protein